MRGRPLVLHRAPSQQSGALVELLGPPEHLQSCLWPWLMLLKLVDLAATGLYLTEHGVCFRASFASLEVHQGRYHVCSHMFESTVSLKFGAFQKSPKISSRSNKIILTSRAF